MAYGPGEGPRNTEGGAHVRVSSMPPNDDFHTVIDPSIGGTVTPEITVNGFSATSSGVPMAVRVTVNPGDDVTGATRLMNGQPEVFMVLPGESIEIPANSNITDVYLIAADFNASALTIADTAYLNYSADTTIANWQAEMAHFTFDSADMVRKIRITVTPVFNTNYCRIKLQGVSYA